MTHQELIKLLKECEWTDTKKLFGEYAFAAKDLPLPV
jgi:hypothetical protein